MWKTILYICLMKCLAILSVFLILSCKIDHLPSCKGEGVEDEICKEYQYVFGRYNGVNEYAYENSSSFLSTITTISKNGSIDGVKRFYYNQEGLLISTILENSNGQHISEKMIFYNAAGDIERETISGNINTENLYYYNEGILQVELFLKNEKVEWTDSLEYYSGTTDIYRKLRYINNLLTQITYFETFTNNILEEKITNSAGITLSRKVTRFNEKQDRIEELTYSSEKILTNKVTYFYVDRMIDRIEKHNESGLEYEIIQYQRYWMKIKVLGTGNAFNQENRFNSAYLIDIEDSRVLVDCGFTVPLSLQIKCVKFSSIDYVVITHYHGDHYAGLSSLLLGLKYTSPQTKKLTIIGPGNVKKKIERLITILYPGNKDVLDDLNLDFKSVSTSGDRLENNCFSLDVYPMAHSELSLPVAYIFEKDNFRIGFSGDTSWHSGIILFAKSCDKLILECNFAKKMSKGHISVEELELSELIQLKKKHVYLTHLSGASAEKASELGYNVLSDGDDLFF